MKMIYNLAALAMAGGLMFATQANASVVNLVNGNFTDIAVNASSQVGYNGQAVAGWTANNYYDPFTGSVPSFTLVYLPGTLDTTGAVNGVTDDPMRMWGLSNGGINALTAPPDGGNIMVMDGAYRVGPLTQTLSGLNIGAQVTVSFYMAGGQEYGYNGSTTEWFTVGLGSESQTTPVLQDREHGFTGWVQQSFTFTATAADEVLSFLAGGSPVGQPPMAMLANVSVTQTDTNVPEPASLTLMAAGLGALGMIKRRRQV